MPICEWRLTNTLRFKGFLGHWLATPATIFYWQQALFCLTFYCEIRPSSNFFQKFRCIQNHPQRQYHSPRDRGLKYWCIANPFIPARQVLRWEKMHKTISLLAGRATVQEEQGQGREIPWVVGLTFQEKFMKVVIIYNDFSLFPVNIFQVVT